VLHPFAQQRWNKTNLLKTKDYLKKEKQNTSNNKIIKKTLITDVKSDVKKTADLVYSEKTKVPELERDPFETFEEFKARIMNYPPIPAGKAKLVKEAYSFKIGEFPLKIEWKEWIIKLNKRSKEIMYEDEVAIDDYCLHVPLNISKVLYQSNQSFLIYIKLTFKDNNPLLDVIELFWNKHAFPIEPYDCCPMEPFINENQKDYIVRVTNYNGIVVGECSLIKNEYDIETGLFPLKIELEQWIDNIYNSSICYPYIVVNREKARELYEKSTKYPIKANFEIDDDDRMPSINKYFIEVNNEIFHIEDMVSTPFINVENTNKILIESVTKMELIYVPGGRFMMGDFFGNGQKIERPVHDVQLDGFYIGKYPVTQGQWKSIMKKNPSHFKGVFKNKNNYPVECVSWNDTQEFIKQINEMNKNEYVFRLPTEAEWEYAARSGGKKEKYAGGDNLDELGWYYTNSNGTTQPVGKKRPNGLGLYDMSGNVWEWCEDIYFDKAYSKHTKTNPVYLESNSGSRVLRGGAWSLDAGGCRAAYRRWNEPSFRNSYIGFRLVSSPRSVI